MAFIFICYIVALYLHIELTEPDQVKATTIVLMIFGCYYLINEIFSFAKNWRAYITDFWNFFDLTIAICLICYSVGEYMYP